MKKTVREISFENESIPPELQQRVHLRFEEGNRTSKCRLFSREIMIVGIF